ncbi:LysR family transcriptional regulator [Pseudomonas sp. PDM14]|uniref:LysR family transcriptional regulator n=1 Tax=Pseudomonas sp. PDM14 TaxID=2769288 RepID=UPI0017811F8B|nr:LysR family transcriptional regulator [Pseudomonas sp. PDM14]MBD9483752.1 LysR family transcriptional regulator [Pseudomonas sp. PDM14]
MFDTLTIDLELAQGFAAAARCACFKQAARSLNMRAALLRKQLKKLETEIGEQLFHYQDRALHLTGTGQRLHNELSRRFGNLRPEAANQAPLRLAVPDSLLHDILARNLIAFIRQHGASRLELLPLEGAPVEQADIMIWLADPESPRPSPGFAMTKPHLLATIDYYPHIATRYFAESRHPATGNLLADYMLVQQRSNLTAAAFGPWNALANTRKNAITIAPQHEMVRELIKNSACVGLLPAYTSRVDRKFIPLRSVFNQAMRRMAWLSMTPLAAQRSEVQALATSILNAFEERHSWFE